MKCVALKIGWVLLLCQLLSAKPRDTDVPIRDLTSFRLLGQEEAALHPKIELTATVVYYVPEHSRLYIQSGTLASVAKPEDWKIHQDFVSGDVVKLSGYAEAGGLSPIIRFSTAKVLKHRNESKLPALETIAALNSPANAFRLVHLKAPVLGVSLNPRKRDRGSGAVEIILGSPQENITATIDHSSDLHQLGSLVGSLVEVRGIVSQTGHRGQFLGSMILVQDANNLKVVKRLEGDPFDIPLTAVSSLLTFTPEQNYERLSHLRGVVTAIDPDGSFFLQDRTQGILVEGTRTLAVQVGELVDVVGYPYPGAFSPRFRFAKTRVLSHGSDPAPKGTITSLDIPASNVNNFESSWLRFDGELVDIEGEFVNATLSSNGVWLSFQIHNRTFTASLEDPTAEIRKLLPGTIVRLRGVCTVLTTGVRHYPTGMHLLLRKPSDLTIQTAPSWWSTKHAMWLAGTVLAVAMILGAWVFALRRQVLAKTKLLHERATRDGLTGLWNRTEILERLRREIEYSQCNRAPLTVILIDLDHFKTINDRYGHQAGDAVLVEASARLRKNICPSDAIGRYGGEELLILLPGLVTGPDHDRLEDLRRSVSRTPIVFEKQEISVTCSLGVAWCAYGELSVEQLIKEADEALYEAKRSGRDQVHYRQPSYCGLSMALLA